ncbi:dol-P-Glc:Glc(2)Man(9)GlcNAc(2)-PP-Dol alpha-1,2-glucosyltransferase isoform X1 [Salvia hispanica]|uniref:dol-P-Glc:Glc(2)Man(9)GlcNAc(2)-PP-Dol alpha-1,2-glucosyltransferase isoform X1 n=2 Tax=Salvia hispanica TaxID=49212 RepID=UPI0020094FDF|nr:dol-P-Glc:Glc(2)Man(9)GlcNAc(2)-PP-Dol alpha-1,2-glucosyltransferase isoform X1 [Salvia hispanica]
MGRTAVASVVTLCLIPVHLIVNRFVPDPYMDEIFHVPQAQHYCRGNFTSWDPMITTPPGLYFLSLAYIASLFPGLFCMRAVPSFSDSCSTSILRLTNGVLAVVCSILVYEIIIHLRPSLHDKIATFRAVVLSLYPLHWFFSFLYYTDVASLTAVLAMYLLVLKKKYICSSLLGAVSVLVRQTNIIWLLFVACTGVIEFAQSHLKDREEEIDKVKTAMQNDDFSDVHKGVSVISKLRKRRVNNGMRNQKNLAVETLNPMVHSSGLLDEIYSIVLVSWNHLLEISVLLSPFLMVFAAFIAFVCWNGSIVLGAKDAHTVSPHFSQFLYYGVVSSLFTFPVHFSFGQASTLSHQLLKNRLLGFFQGFMALALAFLSVKFFSIAHPYLLADNRHYPFYLWRKVINRHWSTKYLMIPFYIYSWFSIVCNLAKNQKKLWVLVYVLACAATLIPTPLIEFRYYTIPFFFMVLHSDIIDNMSWLLLGFLYLCINFFTMYMFLFRPFSWAHEAGTQRFIW